MKLLAIWFYGNQSMAKEHWRTGSHICRSAGGGHRGPQRLLVSSDGLQAGLEKESHGGWGRGVGGRTAEVDLVVVVVVVVITCQNLNVPLKGAIDFDMLFFM